MVRPAIPTWFFVLVAVRRGKQFLLVHECKHGQLWYLPAGRVESGEDFLTAARRETMEEASIPIVLDGIVRFEHSPAKDSARVRLILSARPADDTPPKSEPDDESLEAGWFTVEEAKSLPLRGPEVLDILSYLDTGGVPVPLSTLAAEGDSFVM